VKPLLIISALLIALITNAQNDSTNTEPHNRVKIIQQALILKGYYVGENGAGGVFDLGTREAIIKIQKDTGIPIQFLADSWPKLLNLDKDGNLKFDTIKFMQNTLLEAGYGNLSVNGIIDNPTKNALNKFRLLNGLPATGNSQLYLDAIFDLKNKLNKE